MNLFTRTLSLDILSCRLKSVQLKYGPGVSCFCQPKFHRISLWLADRYFSRSGFQAFDFLKFVFGVCDASQLAEWIEALTALKEPDLAVGEDIPV